MAGTEVPFIISENPRVIAVKTALTTEIIRMLARSMTRKRNIEKGRTLAAPVLDDTTSDSSGYFLEPFFGAEGFW